MQGHAPPMPLASVGKWALMDPQHAPTTSADSAQTAGDPASQLTATTVRAAGGLQSCGSGGLQPFAMPALDSTTELDCSAMMDPMCAKAAIREALVPLSPAELAAVQEQLRQSRLARQFQPQPQPAGGSSTSTTLLHQQPGSSPPMSCCASSGPDDSSSTGAFGGGVVAQVAAALANGVVAQEDVARVLSKLDPAVLQAPQHAAPGALPVPPLHFTPTTALAVIAPAAHQSALPDFFLHHQHYQASCMTPHQARPLAGLGSPVSCVASAPGALDGGRCFSAVSSLALPPAAMLPTAASVTTSTSAGRHPGAAPTKRPRSSGGSQQRRPRSTAWLPGLLSLRRRRPAAASAGAALPPLDMHQHHQQQQQQASAPLELLTYSGPAAAPGTSLAARFARLPAGVQAQLLLELEALAAGEDELRAARGGGGTRGSADPNSLRRSGRARRARDWGSGGFSTTGAGSRSASPDAEEPGAADADGQHSQHTTPKRARLDTSGANPPAPHHHHHHHHHHGSASPMLAGAWGAGGGAAAAWCPPPGLEPLSLALVHEHRQPSPPPPVPRRRRIVRRPGARAAARKAMRRGTFARGKPQRAPAA